MRAPFPAVDPAPVSTWLRDLPVIAGNLIPIVGVVFLGWSPTALLLVYVAELAAICGWTILKIPFAYKRPNNALGDRHTLLGPLQQKRGAIELPGPLPPIYVRNVPVLVFAVILTPVVVGLGFVVFALTRPPITDADAAAFLLGGAGVVLTRGIETYQEYFRHRGYREHSPRSLLLVPFKALLVVGLLFMAVLGIESVVGVTAILSPEQLVLFLAVGKLGYDVRTLRLDRDDTRRGLFSLLYGSKHTEIEPAPVEVPDGEPELRTSMDRPTRVADALGHGVGYLVGFVGVLTVLILGLGVGTAHPGIALFGLVLGGTFVTVRAITRYLRYGTLEYHCYADVLVAYDRLLDEPQAKVTRHAVTDVTLSAGPLDRLLDTASLEFAVASTTDTTTALFVPAPEAVDTDDDANESVDMTVPHLTHPRSIPETLGLSWQLDRDRTE